MAAQQPPLAAETLAGLLQESLEADNAAIEVNG